MEKIKPKECQNVEFKKGAHGIVSYNGADKQFFLMYSNRLKDSNNLLD